MRRHPTPLAARLATRTILALGAILLGPAAALGQGFGTERVSNVAASFEPASVPAGSRAVLTFRGEIDPGYHLYGAKETTGPPIRLRLELAGLELDGAAEVPDGQPHDSLGVLSYWIEGEVVIRQALRVPAGFAAGTHTVKGVLEYMACTEDFCDPPAEAQFAATLTVTAAPSAPAQDPVPGLDLLSAGARKLTVTPRLTPSPARPGERVTLTLAAEVVPGWHVYGSAETASIPTTFGLTTTPASLTEASEAVVPPGTLHSDVLGETSFWLSGEFEMTQSWIVATDATPGTTELAGSVNFLPCDDNSCLDITDLPFTVALAIEAGPIRAAHDPGADSATSAPVEPNPVQPTAEQAAPAITGTGGGGGLLALLLGGIAAGLAALVMPCTYPMIPITFSFFTKQAERRGGRVLPLALTFGAGIIAIFVLIGVLAGQAIQPFATHWITNLIIGVAFVVFAMALFGLVELRPPEFLMDMTSNASTRSGYAGVFLMGATLVIATFACTVPFVGTLLGLGAKEGIGHVALGMAAFGATMAIPFVALSLLPGKMQSLPRAGEWMNVVKVFLGFVELAAALKFLSNVDMVLEWEILPRELFLVLWFGIFGIAGLFLLGVFRLKGEGQVEIGPGRMTIALATILFGLYFLFGAMGNRLHWVFDSLLPGYSATSVSAAGDSTRKTHEIVKDDYEAALASARSQDKLLLINYTGYS